MKAVTLKKKIIIPYNGYIPLKGVNGPIVIPYMETFDNISKLLLSRMPVKEVLTDGTTVDLNLVNYDKENSWNASSTEKKYEAVTYHRGTLRSVSKQAAPILVTDEDVKAKSMEAVLDKSVKGKRAENSKSETLVVSKAQPSNDTYESGRAGSSSKHNKKHGKKNDEFFESK